MVGTSNQSVPEMASDIYFRFFYIFFFESPNPWESPFSNGANGPLEPWNITRGVHGVPRLPLMDKNPDGTVRGFWDFVIATDDEEN